jgi:hypothetical protein
MVEFATAWRVHAQSTTSPSKQVSPQTALSGAAIAAVVAAMALAALIASRRFILILTLVVSVGMMADPSEILAY